MVLGFVRRVSGLGQIQEEASEWDSLGKQTQMTSPSAGLGKNFLGKKVKKKFI